MTQDPAPAVPGPRPGGLPVLAQDKHEISTRYRLGRTPAAVLVYPLGQPELRESMRQSGRHTGMHARLGSATQARTRRRRGPSVAHGDEDTDGETEEACA
jgi:hypothetical protein